MLICILSVFFLGLQGLRRLPQDVRQGQHQSKEQYIIPQGGGILLTPPIYSMLCSFCFLCLGLQGLRRLAQDVRQGQHQPEDHQIIPQGGRMLLNTLPIYVTMCALCFIFQDSKAFVDSLKTYDKDNINPKIIKRIREHYCTNEDFQPEKIAKV